MLIANVTSIFRKTYFSYARTVEYRTFFKIFSFSNLILCFSFDLSKKFLWTLEMCVLAFWELIESIEKLWKTESTVLSQFLCEKFWASVRNRVLVSRLRWSSAAADGLGSTHGGQNLPETVPRNLSAGFLVSYFDPSDSWPFWAWHCKTLFKPHVPFGWMGF